jgi:hypothetical protein
MLCLLIFATPDTISVAQMAKLVDALCSGRSARKGVLVRIQFWARKWTNRDLSWFVHFYFGAIPRPAHILA